MYQEQKLLSLIKNSLHLRNNSLFLLARVFRGIPIKYLLKKPKQGQPAWLCLWHAIVRIRDLSLTFTYVMLLFPIKHSSMGHDYMFVFHIISTRHNPYREITREVGNPPTIFHHQNVDLYWESRPEQQALGLRWEIKTQGRLAVHDVRASPHSVLRVLL